MVYDLRFVHMLLERKDNTTVNPMTFLFLFFNENSILEYQRYERTIFQINWNDRKWNRSIWFKCSFTVHAKSSAKNPSSFVGKFSQKKKPPHRTWILRLNDWSVASIRTFNHQWSFNSIETIDNEYTRYEQYSFAFIMFSTVLSPSHCNQSLIGWNNIIQRKSFEIESDAWTRIKSSSFEWWFQFSSITSIYNQSGRKCDILFQMVSKYR